MSRVNATVCDICKNTINTMTEMYLSKDSDEDMFDIWKEYNIEDICESCRNKIIAAIAEEINKLRK